MDATCDYTDECVALRERRRGRWRREVEVEERDERRRE